MESQNGIITFLPVLFQEDSTFEQFHSFSSLLENFYPRYYKVCYNNRVNTFYKDENSYILNDKLYKAGKELAKNKIKQIQTELDKIEYTLRYLDVNQQYLDATDLYTRPIIERTFVTMDYNGDLKDVRNIEQTSARLYSYAQKNHLSPVFPAGLIIHFKNETIESKVFFEIVCKDMNSDQNIIRLPAGDFLCKQINLTPETDLVEAIHSTFEYADDMNIIVSNMLLSKFQIGTKTSELQQRINKK